jgi:CHAT domain
MVRGCPAAVLVVICPDPAEAPSCAEVIRTGHPGFDLAPIVISPQNAPGPDSGGPWLTVFGACMARSRRNSECSPCAVRHQPDPRRHRRRMTALIVNLLGPEGPGLRLGHSQLPDPPRAVTGSLPLRVLVIRSEPTDLPELQLEEEWAQVTAALRGLTQSGAVTFTPLAKPSLSELRLALMQGRFHVLQYMGHGSFSAQTGGVLYFTGPDGKAVAVTAADLGVILRDHVSMRMAVLNACEGARTDPGDPFAGVAETLVRRGVPAVVAMQFEFTDQAAVEFAPALYGALAAGLPVDAAVTEARKAVYTISPVEWATPVLHLRANDATLFRLSAPTRPSPAPPGHDRSTDAQEPPGTPIPDPGEEQATSVPPTAPPVSLPPGMAGIGVMRRSGEWMFGARGLSVVINGHVAGKLYLGQREIYNLPPGTHRVKVKLDWYSSPEVTVTVAPGDCALFTCGHTQGDKQVRRSVTSPGSYFELIRER